MPGSKVHVLGSADHEAIAAGLPVPRPQDLEHLSQEFNKAISVIFEATPDNLFNSVLHELYAFGEQGNEIVLTPIKELHALMISFTNGWNAFCAAYQHAVLKDVQGVLKRWDDDGRSWISLEDFELSDLSNDMLHKATIGIMPSELQGVTAIDRIDIADWHSALMEMFKDGWNAARMQLEKKQDGDIQAS